MCLIRHSLPFSGNRLIPLLSSPQPGFYIKDNVKLIASHFIKLKVGFSKPCGTTIQNTSVSSKHIQTRKNFSTSMFRRVCKISQGSFVDIGVIC
jgi:hypothetical protein